MKRIIKNSIAVLLCAVMLFGSAPLSGFKSINLSGTFKKIAGWLESMKLSTSASALSSSGQCGTNVYWTFDASTGILTISGEGDMYDYNNYGTIFTPRHLGPSPFTSEGITEVIIQDGVTNICNTAFENCQELTRVIIPESVTSIGSSAFWNCTSLTNIAIPESVTNIGDGAFQCCANLENITMQNGVESIGENAFRECSKLVNISLPESVTSIGDGAFYECVDLENITIPNGVISIGNDAFYNCWHLENITVSNGVMNIGNEAFKKCSRLKNIILPDSVANIGYGAFYECISLENITIPNGVVNIGSEAFGNCSRLKSIILPDSVANIGYGAFRDCWSLESIRLSNHITAIDGGTFSFCTSLTEVTIPQGVIDIGARAFSDCRNIEKVALPDSVRYIHGSAFRFCTSLVDITIPERIRSVEDDAFEGVANIDFDRTKAHDLKVANKNMSPWGARTENGYVKDGLVYTSRAMTWLSACQSCIAGDLIIPDSVTHIECYARNPRFRWGRVKKVFRDCYDITSITIPSSVTTIGAEAFYEVNNIVYSENWYNDVMNGQGSPWGAKAVDAYVENNLYYYDSSKELLLGCSPEVSGAVNIPDSVEEVGENCFSGCSEITSISFTGPVHFADTAVSDCEKLQTVIAPDNTDGFGVVYTDPINNGSFSTASVSEGNISLDTDVGILYCNREAQGEYTVPYNITHICKNAFANCKGISVQIPDSVSLKMIGENAFLNSKDYLDESKWSGNTLTISNYIVAVKNEFSGAFTLGKDIKGIADKAFKQCSAMTGFSFGTNSKLKFLGREAFSECSSEIKNLIHFPKSLRYVGENIFGSDIEDEARETLYIDSVLVSVASDVQSFVIDEGTTQIAAGAFSNCNNLSEIVIPDTVKIIDKNTFKGCPNLKSITFEGNIIEIGDNAFENCVSLTEIIIPASVEEIGNLAFYGCTGMKEFKVAAGNKNYKSAGGVLMSADGKSIIQYPAAKDGTEYVIADNTYVYDLAFYRSRKLRKICIGNDVKYGNRNPFASCTAVFNFSGDDTEILFDNKMRTIKSVSASCSGEFTVPDFVAEIGDDAFRDCTGITNVSFSKAENLNGIGDYAFYGCTGLTKIVIPGSVKEIGRSAFKNCFNLKTVEFEYDESDCVSNLKVIGDYAFCNCQCNASDEKWYEAYFESGAEKYPIIGEYAFSNFENFEIFKNPFCNSAETDNQGFVYGLKPGLESIDAYINDGNGSISSYCNTNIIGTGSVITVKNNLDESEKNDSEMSYIAVVFGDANGDGWYDGTDAVIVSCIANGLLTREQVGGAVWAASDCNHDGEIDSDDVTLLQQSGALLSEVDQTKSPKELLETSSAYAEYLSMINQGVDKQSADIPAEEPIQNSPKTLFDFIIEIINEIFKLFIMNIRNSLPV